MRRAVCVVLVAAASICLCSSHALAQKKTPFSQGQWRLNVGISSSNEFVQLTAGGGYFLLDGLELGADIEQRFVQEPSVTKLSPRLTYTAHFLTPIAPYVGGFYRRWVIGDNQPDLNSIGGRAGVNFVILPNAYVGGGVVYERILDNCPLNDCDSVYPEAFLGFTF